MQLYEQGTGPTLILIPGVQGKWHYVRSAVQALAASFHVVTFSLCGEPESRLPFDRDRGFGDYVGQVMQALDTIGARQAVICGISFGGLIALRFAAAHPDRTRALILVSTPGPSWHLRPRHAVYARWPRIFGPFFLAEMPSRLRAELRAAFPHRAERRRFIKSQLETVAEAPLSLARMAERARAISSADVAAAAVKVASPTLIVTGEAALDHAVPAAGSLEYARLIRDACTVVIDRTGHLGSITRPDAFAGVVRSFVAALGPDAQGAVRFEPNDPEAA
jgi:pimeloyl-ACP methyl ester carboxylesterase